MTLCAFLHPPQYPTLVTDLIASRDGEQVFTPSSLDTRAINENTVPSNFVRKSLFLEDGPAVFGFAGNGDAILDFIDSLKIQYKMRPDDDRPMRFVGDLANSFNENYGSSAISVIGFSPATLPPEAPENSYNVNINAGLEGASVQTEYFNQIFATGSGSARFLESVAKFDLDLRLHPNAHTASLVNLIGLMGALNSTKLFNEQGSSTDDSWGGYLEMSTMHLGKIFLVRPTWTHLAYFVSERNGELHFEKGPKQVHYDPIGEHPSVSVRLDAGRKGAGYFSWGIARMQEDYSKPRRAFDQWLHYMPDFCTIFLSSADGGWGAHRTLDEADKKFLRRVSSIDYEIDPEFLTSLVPKAIDHRAQRERM